MILTRRNFWWSTDSYEAVVLLINLLSPRLIDEHFCTTNNRFKPIPGHACLDARLFVYNSGHTTSCDELCEQVVSLGPDDLPPQNALGCVGVAKTLLEREIKMSFLNGRCG